MSLGLRQIIPPLTARTAWGQTVRAWQFKQKKNLVIAFLHAGCRRCEGFVEKLVAHAAELAESEAVALVVFPEPPAIGSLPAQIIVAADMSGRSQRAYLGEDAFGPAGLERVGVFVADRYGELYAQWVGREEGALPGIGEILSWLSQIELACEECGVSHWPTGA